MDISNRLLRLAAVAAHMLAPAAILFVVVTLLAGMARWAGVTSDRTTPKPFSQADLTQGDPIPAIEQLSVTHVRDLESIGGPKRLAVTGRRILAAGTQQLLVIDKHTGESFPLFASELPLGNALRSSVRSIQCPSEDECWFVGYYGTVSRWHIAPNQSKPERAGYAKHGLLGGFWTRDAKFIANRADPDALLASYLWTNERRSGVELATGPCCGDVSLNVMHEAERDVAPPIRNVHPDLAHYVNRTALAGHVDRGFVMGFLLDSRIQFHDSSGRLRVAVAGPEYLRIDFSIARFADTGRALFRPLPDTRFGYVDVAANEHVVAGLFAGRRFAEHGLDGVSAADRIDVFDWDGRLLSRLRLSTAVRAIALDVDTELLYAVTAESQPRLVVARVPTLPRGTRKPAFKVAVQGTGLP